MRKKYLIKVLFLLLTFHSLLNAQTANTTIPYFCGFEDATENANWVLNAGPTAITNHVNFVNKWIIGTAAHKMGYHAMYVYTNSDATKAEYNGNKAMFTISYREFQIPAGQYDLSFSWRALGDAGSDALYVYWVPQGVAVNSGLTATLPAALNNYKLVYSGSAQQYLNGKASWQNARSTVNVTGTNSYKLVFLWVNNTTNTYNPGGCIDNVQLATKATSTDCWVAPTGLSYSTTTSDVTVTWNATSATSYDLLYFMDGSMLIDSVMGITGTSYTIPGTSLNNGLYSVWVRSVCADGTTGIYSEVSGIKWVDLESAAELPVACPEVTLPSFGLGSGLRTLSPDCPGQPYTVRPTIGASGGSIAGYRVDPIPYAPPYAFNAGTRIFVGQDDIWGDVIALPFGFCFFENTYNQAVVGANGLISFNTDVANQSSGYLLTAEPDIPSNAFKNGIGGNNWKNAIYGVCEDIDPAKISTYNTGGGIYYGILGEYPCRTLTVSWYNVPNFGSSCAATMWNTYQIVLYEGSNVIDVYVHKRGRCADWNAGRGIIGLQNADGTDGIAAPGRNTTDVWSVDETTSEAWRFSPYTTPTYEMTWYKGAGHDGEIIGSADTLLVQPDSGIDTITVRLRYGACNGDYFDLSDTAVIVWPRVDTVKVAATICAGETYNDGYFTETEAGTYNYMLQSVKGCDSLWCQLDLQRNDPISRITEDTVCYGETYTYRGQTFRRTGTYTFTDHYVNGCDSVLDTLRLVVKDQVTFTVRKQDATIGPSSGVIELLDTPENYTYSVNGIMNAPLENLPKGLYTIVVYDENGCVSMPQTVEIIAECLELELIPIMPVCGDEPEIVIPFNKYKGRVNTCDILFDERAHSLGFKDLKDWPVESDYVAFPMSDLARPDYGYRMDIVFHDLICGYFVVPYTFDILYPTSVFDQKWGDVLAVYNTQYNGGYSFAGFQWYQDGRPIKGEENSYLNLTTSGGLSYDSYYQVALRRRGENYYVLSCPIYPQEPTALTYPQMGSTGGLWTATWDGLSGVAEIWTIGGQLYSSQRFSIGTIEITLPQNQGMYIISLKADNGQNQIIKVIIQ